MDLLVGELEILDQTYPGLGADEVHDLLSLAGATQTPAQRFAEFAGPVVIPDHGIWMDTNRGRAWIQVLLDNRANLREYVPTLPRWRARHLSRSSASSGQTAETDLKFRFDDLTGTLVGHGYFDRDTIPDGLPCADNDAAEHIPTFSKKLAEEIGHPGVWEELAEARDLDAVYELIETLYDLVARPRRRKWPHRDEDCPGHYGDFDTDSGRRIYRCLINRILTDSKTGLQLADHGPQEGRLLQATDAARTDLIDLALTSAPQQANQRVEHAIGQFRARDATEHDKRSAVITLAGVLEERRALIRADIGKKDEGALFQLANEFSIRHQNRSQHGYYDPAFLDWMFWWYLATVELTNAIIERQHGDPE